MYIFSIPFSAYCVRLRPTAPPIEIITDSKAGRNLLNTDEMWYGDVSDSETLTAILDMMMRDGLPEWCNNVKLYMEEGE